MIDIKYKQAFLNCRMFQIVEVGYETHIRGEDCFISGQSGGKEVKIDRILVGIPTEKLNKENLWNKWAEEIGE